MDYTNVRITANNLEYQTSEFRLRMKRFGIYGNFLERRLCHWDTFTGSNVTAWDFSTSIDRNRSCATSRAHRGGRNPSIKLLLLKKKKNSVIWIFIVFNWSIESWAFVLLFFEIEGFPMSIFIEDPLRSCLYYWSEMQGSHEVDY